jgi:hypothetical protein
LTFLEGSHTAERISREMKRIIHMWGLDGLVAACTTDNASNYTAAMVALLSWFCFESCNQVLNKDSWQHIRCAAHTLQLCIETVFKACLPAVRKLRAAVKFVRKSSLGAEALQNWRQQHAETCGVLFVFALS